MRHVIRGCCWGVVFAGLALLLARSSAAANGRRSDGQPRATIIVAKDVAEPAKGKRQTAAGQLQAYVQKMCGAKLPIVDDGQDVKGPVILVGRSRLSDALGVPVPAGVGPDRRDEGFVIVCRGDRLLLVGNDDGPYHGTEYAVYDFLRSLGVRWFMPGDFGEIVPRQKTIRVPEQQVREKPDFVMRNWWLHAQPELAEQEARWKLRNKMNPEPMFAIAATAACGQSSPPSRFGRRSRSCWPSTRTARAIPTCPI